MGRNRQAGTEFDTADIFRKLTSKHEPQTQLEELQMSLAEVQRRKEFLRDLGQLCLKYGVGGIYEAEYAENGGEHVVIKTARGVFEYYVQWNDNLATIAHKIFEAVLQ